MRLGSTSLNVTNRSGGGGPLAGAAPPATYSLTADANSVDEGSSLTFNVTATNANNTTVYWKITPGAADPITLSDFSSVTNGSVTINSSGQASFTITADADATTETNPEYFNVELHTDSAMSGTPVAYVNGLALNDTSRDPTYALSTANPAVNEGSTITFNLVTTDVADQTMYWTVAGVANPTTGRSAASAADFNNVTSGSWAHSGGSSSFQIGPLADTTTEGEEEFIVEVRTGSASGPVVADLEPILINDTSKAGPSWTLTSNSGSMSVDEGSGFVVDVAATNITGTPTYHWLVRASSVVNQGTDFASGGYTGSFTMTNTNGNGSGQFTVTPLADNATEGSETMYIDLYSDSSFGTKLGDIGPITVNDTSKAVDATMTPAGGTTVDEGATMTVNVATEGIANGATLYWEIFSNSNYNPTVTPSADFNAYQGSFTVSATGNWGDGSGSFQITCVADQTTEGDEQFDIRLFSDSARTVNISNLYGLTVRDTSTAAPTTFTLKYHGYGADIRPLRLFWVDTTATTFLLDTLGTNGQTHSLSSASWTSNSYSLGAYTGTSGYIALVAQQGASTSDLGDWGVAGQVNYASGTTIFYGGSSTSGRAKWRHAWGYSSSTSAAAATPTSTLNTNPQHRWGYITGGSTPTSNTGPSAGPGGTASQDYIYFDPSGASSSLSYTFAVLKMDSSFVP